MPRNKEGRQQSANRNPPYMALANGGLYALKSWDAIAKQEDHQITNIPYHHKPILQGIKRAASDFSS